MPKMKTSSAAKKRLKVTSGGKIKHRRAFDSHNFEHKSAKRQAPQAPLEGTGTVRLPQGSSAPGEEIARGTSQAKRPCEEEAP